MSVKILTVVGTSPKVEGTDGAFPLDFYERDDQHPDKDAWVAGPTPVKVAETPAVIAAIKNGKIKEVSAAEAKSLEKASTASTASTQTTDPNAAKSDFEDDFPYRDILIGQGVTTKAQLKGMSKEQMLALKEIGEARMKEIAERLK